MTLFQKKNVFIEIFKGGFEMKKLFVIFKMFQTGQKNFYFIVHNIGFAKFGDFIYLTTPLRVVEC